MGCFNTMNDNEINEAIEANEPEPQTQIEIDNTISIPERKGANLAFTILISTTIILLFFVGFLFVKTKKQQQRYQASIPMQIIYIPWDPVDWHSLKKNPLLYKSMSDVVDEMLDENFFYEEYIKKPESIGVAVTQTYFDDSLRLIDKNFIRHVSETVVKKAIKSELNLLFKEYSNIKKKEQEVASKDGKKNLEENFEKPLQADISDLDLHNNFLNLVVNRYGSKIDSRVLSYSVIIGLFKGINDPYSFVLGADSLDDMMERLSDKTFGGVGLLLESSPENDNMLTVVEPLEGTPAYKAGILPGDIIIKIDDSPTKKVDMNVSVSKIRGKKGTPVKLEVKRDTKTLVFDVIRDDIKTISVTHKMLDNAIGYIRVRQFATGTVEEFEKALEDLRLKNVEGLIVDLRNNGGGLLDSGLTLSSLFLEPGSIIMKKMQRGNIVNSFYGGTSNPITLPTVLLINRFSASASEIMAAALKDNHSAILLGERTFGKGSVQQLFQRDDGSAIKMTIAYFMSPNCNIINKKGVMPDYLKEMKPIDVGRAKDTQLQQAERLLVEKIKETS